MNRQFSNKLQMQVKSLFIKLQIIQILLFLLLCSIFVTSNYYLKSKISSIVGTSTRNTVIINDIRETINTVKKIGVTTFKSIFFQNSHGEAIFQVPSTAQSLVQYQTGLTNWILFSVIEVPVRSSLNKSSTIVGKFFFVYYRFEYITYAILLWLISITASFFFMKKSKLKLEIEYRKELQAKKNSLISEIAGQVAHDIRSPLAALDTIMKDLGSLPEPKRLMIRSASTRIHDIANNLLQQNRSLSTETDLNNSQERKVVLLPAIVESILTEKRMQFRSKMGININSNIKASSYGLFVKVAPRELKRVCSNLLNNSIEALGESGNITVDIHSCNKDEIEIQVKDDGVGICSQILNRLGKRGETHGKPAGNGLGLFHARTSVESWRGSLKIDSQVGKGTTVKIRLPKSAPPKTFVPEIKVTPNSTVIVVDDDESIHQVWKGRFASINIKNHGVKVLHFCCPEDVAKWLNSNNYSKNLFLVDYEYIGRIENGLDFIEKYKISNCAYLVTSRFEEKQLQNRCETLKVGLISKGMAGFIPLSIVSTGPVEGYPTVSTPTTSSTSGISTNILVDDDELVRMVWTSTASDKGIPFKVYSNADEVMKELHTFSRGSTFYIDSNLENDVKGEDVLKKLFDLGFTNLYLATGYGPEEFRHLEYIKGVLGKEPPDSWLQL